MKFLLSMHINPALFGALTEEERSEIGDGHGAFIDAITKSGELITTQALADPSQSAVVRVRGGQPAVTDGPYLEAKEFVSSFFILDCQDESRALHIAAEYPFAAHSAVDVWPVLHEAGLEM